MLAKDIETGENKYRFQGFNEAIRKSRLKITNIDTMYLEEMSQVLQ